MSADRGTWRLIAARDFWVRLRERSFLISTLLNVTVISVLVLARAASGGGTQTFDLGYVGGQDVADVANGAATLARQAQIDVHVTQLQTASDAETALRLGTVDAVVTTSSLQGLKGVDPTLEALVQASDRNLRLTRLLDRHEVPQSERDAAGDPAPLDVHVFEPEPPPPPTQATDAGVAFIGVLLLYGQLFGYGIWVASGVIEEKASRVVEMLLSAIRPRQLLAGKIIGIGALGLCQLALIAGFAIALATLTHANPLPASALKAAALVIGWFILGFAFYATLFAAAGSLVTRMEELQNVIVPINLTILVSFFISIGALQNPNSTLAVIASILPVSSALAMPVRIVLGAATGWQVALSLSLLIASTIVLVPVGARLYSGAVLRTGARVKVRDAWSAS